MSELPLRRGVVRVGTAGWAVPRAAAPFFPSEGVGLARYAARFPAVEINSTFYRRHRPDTFLRWRQTVPKAFRFAVKLPRAITHEARLGAARVVRAALDGFFEDVAPLGPALGPLLVQLPPSLAFDRRRAAAFFAALRARHDGAVACEPRHASWYELPAERLLGDHGIARVIADPPRPAAALTAAGAQSLVYVRLHGSPVIYRTPYGAERLERWAAVVRAAAARADVYCIFDNTASGAAATDALGLMARLGDAPLGEAIAPA